MFVSDPPIPNQATPGATAPAAPPELVSANPEKVSQPSGSTHVDESAAAAAGLEAALRAVQLLRSHASTDRSFREGLRHLASLLLRIAGAEQPEAIAPGESPPRARDSHAGAKGPAAQPAIAAPPARRSAAGAATGVVPLHLGDARVEVVVPGTGHELISMQRRDPAAEREARREAQLASERAALASATARSPDALPDLNALAAHAELKSAALRWAVERRRRERAGADHAELRARDQDLMAKVKAQPGCWIWCLSPSRVTQPDEALERLAEVHENLALAARLVAELDGIKTEDASAQRPETWQLFAEAQSALRKANLDLALDTDGDQDDAFHWLRTRTERDRVFVARHMRIGDPADPEAWAALRQRIATARERLHDVGEASKARRRVFSKIRFIAGKLVDVDDAERESQWRSLDEAMDRFVDAGGNPSDRELRELLIPVLDTIPESLEAGPALRRALDAIEAWLERSESESAPRERATSPEVLRVAELLRGSVVLLIGGERRRTAEEALRNAFELAELRWIPTQEHQSIAPFESEVARRDVALVLLPIRWASHSFEGVQEFCERYGKPFVRLPAGYHPNRVAVEVLKQVERQLVEARSGAGGEDPVAA